ncbi:Gfo/Idh/MocA family protein [Brevifollis gellanilyticus]|uniref:NADH-dependent dehydrogenase n=1 Tax=Brevifollis gellanilyticus TaxID=748831 RepID=A0A512M2A6_9BACT|nr:Gfo/Idh/MocA family oxidoreductase [Brevifollis gellanilyticus]GEP40869.1 NADH-dependent dehydrogenase [Brevifollis gellanilyticus]
MHTPTRRSFLRQTALATTALSASRVLGANDKIRIASIGLGGQGSGNAGRMAKVPGVEIAYLCDADTVALDKAKLKYPNAKTTQDMRKVMEDPTIDAVVVSTGNHWHVLASIWACQAGKDVYVEKPVSHNIWEGRKLVEAARKYNRIVQGGTQQRSDPFHDELKAYLDSGELGKIKYVRCNHYGQRASIGKRETPLAPPTHVDYNLWLGPAQDIPIMRERLQYDWHWVWNTGNGELGNWGPHILDDLRSVVFRDKIALPKRVLAGGGRLGWNDAGETPNTHFIYFDTGDIPVVMDVHNLPRKAGMKASDVYLRRRTSAFMIIECENGYYEGGRGGGSAHDASGKVVKKFKGDGGGTHAANFISAIRSRKKEDLKGEIEKIHYSSAWCHLGNISYRLGQAGDLDQAKAALKEFEPWQEMLSDEPAHLTANDITLKAGDIKVGKMLEIDAAKETFIGDSATPEALALLKREYRAGFEVPDMV